MTATPALNRRAAVLALAATALATAAAAGPAASHADAAAGRKATVVRIIDGDDLVANVAGARTRIHLSGISAPAARRCFAGASAARLRALLPKDAKVRVRGANGAAIVTNAAGSDVAQLLVASGHAKALAGGGSRGRVLRSAQSKARRNGRGLWSRCAGAAPATQSSPESPAPAQSSPAPVDPKAAFTAMLRGIRVDQFESSFSEFGDGGFSSETIIDFCADGTFRYEHSFTSSVSEPTDETDSGTWSVTAAQIGDDGQSGSGTVRLVGNQGPNDVGDYGIFVARSGRAAIGNKRAIATQTRAC
jgi:endonuclease YncB( thermonuclease family)